jgi:hypothetical protein
MRIDSKAVSVMGRPGRRVLDMTGTKLNPVSAATVTLNHPWKFAQDGDTAGAIALGKVYMGGVEKMVASWPTNGEVSAVMSTTLYWIALDFSAATATFGSGATLTTNTATIEYWHVLTLTCAGSVITAVYNPWPCDIRALLNP